MATVDVASIVQQRTPHTRTAGARYAKVGKLAPASHRHTRAEKSRDDTSELACKGPIAMLQEFVQCSKAYPLPPNCSALQWTYDTRMASKASLEYRAVVAFYLDGIPHHAAGTWHASKKCAQRDAADRALRLFVGKWGGQLLRFRPNDKCLENSCHSEGTTDTVDPERLLENFCAQLPMCAGSTPLRWAINQEGCEGNDDGSLVAVVELCLLGVPHKLAGTPNKCEQQARADTARRALWYLQCPGFEATFEPERVASGVVPPVGHWLNDESDQEAIAEANRKTVVMRTQNRLQQAFARQLQGVGVWEWSYETDSKSDNEWPPFFRATVSIPMLEKEFSGNWARGQRDAQIDAIACVNAFLDEMAVKSAL